MKLLTIGATAALALGIVAPAFAQGPHTSLRTVSVSQSGTGSSTGAASGGNASVGGVNTTGNNTISAMSQTFGTAGAQAAPSGSTSYTLQGAQGSATGKNAFFTGAANDTAGGSYYNYMNKYTSSVLKAYEPFSNIDP